MDTEKVAKTNDLESNAPAAWWITAKSYGKVVAYGACSVGLLYYGIKKALRLSVYKSASELPRDYFEKNRRFFAKALDVVPPQQGEDLELLTVHMGTSKYSFPRVVSLFIPLPLSGTTTTKNDLKKLQESYPGHIRIIVPNVSVCPEYMPALLESIANSPNLCLDVMGEGEDPYETIVFANVGIKVKHFLIYRHQDLGIWILKNGYGRVTPYNKKLALHNENYEYYHAKLMYAEGKAHGKNKGIWKNSVIQDSSKWALFTGLLELFMSTIFQKKIKQ